MQPRLVNQMQKAKPALKFGEEGKVMIYASCSCTYILWGVCHMVGLRYGGTGQGYLNEYHWKPFQSVLGGGKIIRHISKKGLQNLIVCIF